MEQTEDKKNIWLCIPCYGGQAYIATYKSIIHDMFPLVMQGHTVRIYDDIGHADIYHLRAQIVAAFLQDKAATDLIFIDSDVAWEPYGLQALLDHDVDVVAGAYPKRQDPITFMYRAAEGPLIGDPDTGLVEVWGMPGGFMRIKRHVLEKMWDAYPDLVMIDQSVPGGKCCRMFDPYWYTDEKGIKKVQSEDYSFCSRWRDIGGKVYLDARIGMAHIGTKAFMGKLGEWKDILRKPEAAE